MTRWRVRITHIKTAARRLGQSVKGIVKRLEHMRLLPVINAKRPAQSIKRRPQSFHIKLVITDPFAVATVRKIACRHVVFELEQQSVWIIGMLAMRIKPGGLPALPVCNLEHRSLCRCTGFCAFSNISLKSIVSDPRAGAIKHIEVGQ